MKPTEVLTAIIAIYAAILSTINVILVVRSKRWHLAVTLMQGSEAGRRIIGYRAVNIGERTVALKRFNVTLVRAPRTWRRIVPVQNLLSVLDKFRMREGAGFFFEAHVVRCEPPLPTELSPGRSCEMVLDQAALLDFVKDLEPRTVAIRGVFEDETGRWYRSQPTKVEVLLA